MTPGWVVYKQKTVKSILKGLQIVETERTRTNQRTFFPTGAPVQHLTVGATLAMRQKMSKKITHELRKAKSKKKPRNLPRRREMSKATMMSLKCETRSPSHRCTSRR